jgi:hypothetical protein
VPSKTRSTIADILVLVMCAIGLPTVAGALSNVRRTRDYSCRSFRYARMAPVHKRFNNELDMDSLRQVAREVGSAY